MRDKIKRRKSEIKTLTWRIFASFITVMIAFFFTGSIEIGLSIGGLEFVFKILAYYLHERIWERNNEKLKE